MAGDITRIQLNVHKFYNSETIEGFSNEELGQYVRLMCKAILLGKEASLPDDMKILAKWADTTERKLSSAVLEQYPVVRTEFGPRRRNAVLYDEWCRVCGISEAARESVSQRADRKPTTTPLNSTNGAYDRTTNVQREYNDRSSRVGTIHNITKQNTTEQHTNNPATLSSVGDTLQEVQSQDQWTDKTVAGQEMGTPGFYVKGRWRANGPKEVFRYCVEVYKGILGVGGYLRYPTKHPKAPTDAWEDMCDTTPADIIVPAFELWVAKEGKFIKTQWALSEFLKGETAGKYINMVVPTVNARPGLTPEKVDEINKRNNALHEAVWAVPETNEPTASANDFLEMK